MKDPAHPHVDPHHGDAAHPHVRTSAPDPAMRKVAMFGVIGGVVAIGAVVALMSSTVREVAIRNEGSVDVRVEYAWKANGDRVTRDKQVAPGSAISFKYQPDSELVIYHPAPDDKAAWTVVPVAENERKFVIAPKTGGVLSVTQDGQPVSASLIPIPAAVR
jgi:hypothetical protein